MIVRRSTALVFAAVVATSIASPSAFANDVQRCPTSQEFSQALADGSYTKLPYVTLQAGFRVQMQHPDTHLTAHAKFFDRASRPGYACQYYNYAGMVATLFYVGYERTEGDGKAFWRNDFQDSLDRDGKAPNSKMTMVCMERRDGAVFASAKRAFKAVD